MNDPTISSIPGITVLPNGNLKLRVNGWVETPSGRKKRFRQQTLPAGLSRTEVLNHKSRLLQELGIQPSQPAPVQTIAPTLPPQPVASLHQPIESDLGAPLLVDYVEQWLVRTAQWKKRSTREKEAYYLSQVLPELGHLRVTEIRLRHLEGWLATMRAAKKRNGKPYSPHTIHSFFRVLREVLRDACADYECPDPTLRVRSHKVRRPPVRETRTLSADEVRRLMEAVKASYPDWYAELLTLATTGMRPGELYALERRDFDFERGLIRIERAHWRGTVSSTKTDSPREVGLPAQLAEVILEHFAEVDCALGEGVELAFPGAEGKIRYDSSVRNTLIRSSAIAGLDIKVTAQVLRRTVNTRLVASGVSEVVIRSILGHSNAQMTHRYAGIRPETKVAAMEGLIPESASNG